MGGGRGLIGDDDDDCVTALCDSDVLDIVVPLLPSPTPLPPPLTYHCHPHSPTNFHPPSTTTVTPTHPPSRYAHRLDEILRRKQQLITQLRDRLTGFRQRLAEEESAASTVALTRAPVRGKG